MKAALLVVTLLICSSLAFGEQDWMYVNRDEKVNRFQINTNGKLHLEGQIVEGFTLQQTSDRIGISPSSPDGKFAVILSFGDQSSECSLLQFEKRAATILSLQGTPIVWQSWSPESSYLLLSTYSDAENSLYSVPLASVQTKRIPVQLHKEAEKIEFDTSTVTWTAPDTFQIEATIHCAPGKSGCDSQAEEKVLRIYKLTVNAESLQVIPEQQPLPQEDM